MNSRAEIINDFKERSTRTNPNAFVEESIPIIENCPSFTGGHSSFGHCSDDAWSSKVNASIKPRNIRIFRKIELAVVRRNRVSVISSV